MTSIPDVALIDNTSQRLPCALVLDASGSMSGPPISELNKGLRLLELELKSDDIASQRVQLLIIQFGGDDEVRVLGDWTDAMAFTAPSLEASGRTPMGMAVREALNKIQEQKARYDAHGIASNRPWLFLITDGDPTDANWDSSAAECRAAEEAGKVVVFCIGVGDAKLDSLRRFSVREPLKLQGLNFRELFIWLSRSTSKGSRAAQGSNVQMPAPTGCAEIPA
jgi:uncharacterized protein YegL